MLLNYIYVYISLFVCTEIPPGVLLIYKVAGGTTHFIQGLCSSWIACSLLSLVVWRHPTYKSSSFAKEFSRGMDGRRIFLDFFLCIIPCAIRLNFKFQIDAYDCSFADIFPPVFFWDVQDRRKQIQLSFVGHFTSESADRSYTGYVSSMIVLLYYASASLPHSTLIYTNIILALPYADNSLHLCRQELHRQCLHYAGTSLCWYFSTSLQTVVIRAMSLPIVLGEQFYYLWGKGATWNGPTSNIHIWILIGAQPN